MAQTILARTEVILRSERMWSGIAVEAGGLTGVIRGLVLLAEQAQLAALWMDKVGMGVVVEVGQCPQHQRAEAV
jgi:hypothetical protein